MNIVKILNDHGFKTIVGADAVKKAIRDISGQSNTKLCSGYGVFPDGNKCQGCNDCVNKQTINR